MWRVPRLIEWRLAADRGGGRGHIEVTLDDSL